MSREALDTPIRPVIGGPRGTGDRARIAAIVVVTLGVVAAGIGLAGRAPKSPSSGPGGDWTEAPATSPTMAATPASSDIAAGTPATPGPTIIPPAPCAAVPAGLRPEFSLGSAVGMSPPVLGFPDPTIDPGTAAIRRPATPPVRDAAILGGAGGDGLVLVADGGACVRRIAARYWPADPTLAGPFPVDFRDLDVLPVRATVALGPLPDGDWVVLVATTYGSGASGAATASVTRVFRVLVGAGAGSLPPPVTAPAVPCRWSGPGSGSVLELSGAAGATVVPGTASGVPAMLAAVPGAPLEIRMVGDRCAIAWTLTARDLDTNSTVVIASEANPTNDPFRYAQNRWLIPRLPSGLDQITAVVAFSQDTVVTERWSIAVAVPEPPAATFTAADGAVVSAVAGCGTTWSYPGATELDEACAGGPLPDRPRTLAVPAGTAIRFDVPGWTVTGWSSACGRLDPSNGSTNPVTIVDECRLGGSGVPGPVVVVPRAGAPVVWIGATIRRAGVIVTISAYVVATEVGAAASSVATPGPT